MTYPLRLYVCPESGLAQLDYAVDGNLVYHPDYPYRSGITKELEVYLSGFAQDVVSLLGTPEGALCVDIGSNDGTLLTGFKKLGMNTLGIEPTNIAKIAQQENHIDTIQSFFTEELALNVIKDYGHATIITATNVLAHMSDIGEVMRGIVQLLDKNGVFITESHYLLDVIEKTQFDTVYHEHVRTYSLKSLVILAERYGLEVFNVQRADRYGGNIRAYIGHAGMRSIDPSVGALQRLEEEKKLFSPETYKAFRQRVYDSRDRFMDFAYQAQRKGLLFAGNSCPARCVTLLNFYGITRDLMPYIAEQPTSLKLGMYLPGKQIPVVMNQRLLDDQPEYVVLLAWHFAESISQKLRARGLKSKLITPLPTCKILDI